MMAMLALSSCLPALAMEPVPGSESPILTDTPLTDGQDCLTALPPTGVETTMPPIEYFREAPDLGSLTGPGCVAITVILRSDGFVRDVHIVSPHPPNSNADSLAQKLAQSIKFLPPLEYGRPFGIAVDFKRRPDQSVSLSIIAGSGLLYRMPVPEPVTDQEFSADAAECQKEKAALTESEKFPKTRFERYGQFYLPMLRRLGIQGCVVLAVEFRPDGTIDRQRVVAEYPKDSGLAASALYMVDQAVYEPPADAALTYYKVVQYRLE